MQVDVSEEWRDIPGFPKYQASSLGRVRRGQPGKGTSAGRILCQWEEKFTGYCRTRLADEFGVCKSMLVSRLVCFAFHGMPPEGRPFCAHGDGNRLNNTPENLRWASHWENFQDMVGHGSRPCITMTQEIADIIRAYPSGSSRKAIAEKHGATEGMVYHIRKRGSTYWRGHDKIAALADTALKEAE